MATLNLPSKLVERPEPIDVGIIGAGLFGTNLIDQIERVPGMRSALVADIDTGKASRTLANAGVDDVTVADDVSEANAAMDAGRRAVVADGSVAAASTVDVVVEATGVPDIGARHAYEAITSGKHVVMVTVEADTVVGPTLTRLAENNGVTYTMAYGDQPSFCVELCDWARSVGLDIVAVGKGNAYTTENRRGTPDDIFDRLGFSDEFVEANGLNPRMFNSFFDGTKVAVEMCAVANALGFEPDVPGMHIPTAEIPEIPEKLRPEEDGGLLSGTGVVDTISTVYDDGSTVDHGIGFGMFIVTSTPTARIQNYLRQYAGDGLYVANDGEYQVFYRPFHLPGIETPVSIANAAIRNEATGAVRHQHTEVVGAAKRDLRAGTELDGGGGTTVYGHLVTAAHAEREGYVPFELLDGGTLRNDVGTDEVVTYDDVDLDEGFLHSLRQIQAAT